MFQGYHSYHMYTIYIIIIMYNCYYLPAQDIKLNQICKWLVGFIIYQLKI